MTRVSVPRNEWPEFCDAFTRLHEGWLVSLEVSQPGGARGREAFGLGRDQPLIGVTVELLDQIGEDRVTIIVGQEPDNHLDHIILEPTAITLERDQNGADAGLIIESPRSGTTALRFRAPVLPETVDSV